MIWLKMDYVLIRPLQLSNYILELYWIIPKKLLKYVIISFEQSAFIVKAKYIQVTNSEWVNYN